MYIVLMGANRQIILGGLKPLPIIFSKNHICSVLITDFWTGGTWQKYGGTKSPQAPTYFSPMVVLTTYTFPTFRWTVLCFLCFIMDNIHYSVLHFITCDTDKPLQTTNNLLLFHRNNVSDIISTVFCCYCP